MTRVPVFRFGAHTLRGLRRTVSGSRLRCVLLPQERENKSLTMFSPKTPLGVLRENFSPGK